METTATSKQNSQCSSSYSHHTDSSTAYSPTCCTPPRPPKRTAPTSLEEISTSVTAAKRALNALKEAERRGTSPSKFVFYSEPLVVKQDKYTEQLTLQLVKP